MTWNDFVIGLSMATIGRPSLSLPYVTWNTKLCRVVSPRQPSFAIVDADGIAPIDKALVAAENLVKAHKPWKHPQFREHASCLVKIVTIEDLVALAPLRPHERRYGVTKKYVNSAEIWVNTFNHDIVGHELIHWVEWKYFVKGDEEFAYKFEGTIGKYL